MRARRSPQWQGCHIYMERPFEPFLRRCLFPWAATETAAGRVRRFFFLRYDEGGPHIRLRTMAGRSATGDVYRALREQCDSGLGVWPACRFEDVRYAREAMYFGTTIATVYSDLLNVETSSLAMRVLRADPDHTQKWLTAAAMFFTIQRSSTNAQRACSRSLLDSSQFARLILMSHNDCHDDRRLPPNRRLDAALRHVILGAPSWWAADATVAHTAALIRRVRRYVAGGSRVATHALHLLINKLGLSTVEEYKLTTAVWRVHLPVAAEHQ